MIEFYTDGSCTGNGKDVNEGGFGIVVVKDGKCINTTMGLTPLGGIVMGTRCGDMDPSVVLELMEKENLCVEQARTLLNKNCRITCSKAYKEITK